MICVTNANPFVSIIERPSEPFFSLIASLVKETFYLLKSLYDIPAGLIEIVIGLVKKNTTSGVKRVKTALTWFYQKIVSFSTFHGLLIAGAGGCELALGLNQLELISLGLAMPMTIILRSGCFIMAEILSLVYYTKCLIKACRVRCPNSEIAKEQLERVKTASILAIFSALNYIFGAGLALLGAPGALILVLMALGVTISGIKFLYNILCPQKD